MKHIFYLMAGMLLCLGTALSAKSKVIDKPQFRVRNTTSIEVSKVVMSDSATILHIYAKYRPKYWITIAPGSFLKDNNGETYLIRGGIGIKPGEKFWMPESGEAEFQLIFPPVSANATSIDFAEGEDIDDAFCIWGIELKGKKLPELVLPKEAVIHPIEMNTTLPPPIIRYGKATLKGKLLDYTPGMQKELAIYLQEPAKGYGESIKIEVESDGSFSTSLDVTGTTLANAVIDNVPIRFFVEPEQTSEIFINLRELSRQQSKFHKNAKPYGAKAYINGPLATVAQEWNQSSIKTSLVDNYTNFIEKVGDMDVYSFKSYLLEKKGAALQKLNNPPLSKACKELLTLEIELSTNGMLNNVLPTLTQAYTKKNNLSEEASKEYFHQLHKSMPKDYIPTTAYQTMNTPQATLTTTYMDAIRGAATKKTTLSQIMGTDKGCLFDVLNANVLYQAIKDFTPMTDEQKTSLSTLPDAYQQMILQANEQLLQTIEANKKKDGFTINEVGEVSNEELFTSIISKFRGKVLLVDIWATWCGPCRMANKLMLPMKKELKAKDIVYLYIAGENSPQKTWENMITDIHGEHYRVTDAQWRYLCDSFKVEGVPTYIIIDKEGNTLSKYTGFPGVAKMKVDLLKADI